MIILQLGFYLRIMKFHHSKLYLKIIKTGKKFIYSFFFLKRNKTTDWHTLLHKICEDIFITQYEEFF